MAVSSVKVSLKVNGKEVASELFRIDMRSSMRGRSLKLTGRYTESSSAFWSGLVGTVARIEYSPEGPDGKVIDRRYRVSSSTHVADAGAGLQTLVIGLLQAFEEE